MVRRAKETSMRPAKGMPTTRTHAQGALVIVGGHEDKKGEKLILREVAKRVGDGKLVVATLASEVADQMWVEYERIFRRLGVKHVWHLDIDNREEVIDDPPLRVLEG